MKIGKVSETVLKRSIFKQIRTKREEVVLGAGVGEDCAAIQLKEDETFVISTDPITGTVKDIGSLSVHVTANDLASAGAEPIGIMLTVLLPENVYESDLKEMMQQVEDTCAKLHIQVMGGHTEITRAVNQPIISVTGVGKVKNGKMVSTGGAKPGQDIVVSKWIGLEGTSILAKENESALLKKYPTSLVETAKDFDCYISVIKEAAEAVKSGVSAMHDVTEGGIYGALWEMAEASSVGLEIDLKKIPIRQETIEICEFFDLNPYCLISSGSMLMAIDNGHELVRNLNDAGISAAVIGKAVKGNDRVILNEDERRFLEPPKSDEIYNVKSEERLENQI
jgi:hydrogenase expression/formation protein HypE